MCFMLVTQYFTTRLSKNLIKFYLNLKLRLYIGAMQLNRNEITEQLKLETISITFYRNMFSGGCLVGSRVQRVLEMGRLSFS
jgi:hypothetical protein